MKDFLNQPELEKFRTSYSAGQPIFQENEASHDLYILVSGTLEVFKGRKAISDITTPGTLFGEMSYLLGSKRTATVKAMDNVEVLRIPSDQVTSFLHDFPLIASTVTSVLAERLNETTNIMYGLKGFCDQLPDAVVMTDKDKKILAWNTAAEKLYGRTWAEMKNRPLSEIYDNQAAFKFFIDELDKEQIIKEKILKINHPIEEWKFVSTSTTILYDFQQHAYGYVFIGRDVTKTHVLEQKQKKKKFYIPAVCLVLVLALFFTWYNFSSTDTEIPVVNQKHQQFTTRLSRDSTALRMLLSLPFKNGDTEETTKLMEEYFNTFDPKKAGINGLLLVDNNGKIFNVYSPEPKTTAAVLRGTKYNGTLFKTDEPTDGKHHVYLSSSAPTENSAGVDIGFEINRKDENIGWLILQLDMPFVEDAFDISVKSLPGLQF